MARIGIILVLNLLPYVTPRSTFLREICETGYKNCMSSPITEVRESCDIVYEMCANGTESREMFINQGSYSSTPLGFGERFGVVERETDCNAYHERCKNSPIPEVRESCDILHEACVNGTGNIGKFLNPKEYPSAPKNFTNILNQEVERQRIDARRRLSGLDIDQTTPASDNLEQTTSHQNDIDEASGRTLVQEAPENGTEDANLSNGWNRFERCNMFDALCFFEEMLACFRSLFWNGNEEQWFWI